MNSGFKKCIEEKMNQGQGIQKAFNSICLVNSGMNLKREAMG